MKREMRGGGNGRGARAIRFAVVGQGYFAQAAILPAFQNAKGCELTALFSDDETKLRTLKRKYRVEHALAYDEYDDFLRSGAVDAVYIALPNDQHREYTVRAAAAGVHVLCEKPMAVTSAECEQMIAACQRARVKLMVAYRLHFEEANLSAVELVQRGTIGEPRFFSSEFAQQVTAGNIRTQAARGGGPLYDIGIYCINAARYLFRAEPEEVTAVSSRRPADPRFREVEEQIAVAMRFPGERLAQLTCSFGGHHVSTYSVIGTEGRLRVEPAYEYAGALAWELEVGDKVQRKTFRKRDQIAPELEELAACIREGRDPATCDGREGLADIRVIEAIQMALQTGRRVRLPEGRVGPEARPSARQERRAPPHGEPDVVNVQPPSRR